MTNYIWDDRIERNHDCNVCGAAPSDRHEMFCDTARCRSTGAQQIQCEGEEHEYNGRLYGEHAGPCEPDVWDGEYPGTKQCRELGWFKEMTTYDGKLYMGTDLNRLYGVNRGWNPVEERFIL